HSGQVSTAAKELGVSRATMYRLLNKHNLITDENF
ncbi:TPA: helix-turn-helix domain-containing protein, partial [Vibrio cholerae O1]